MQAPPSVLVLDVGGTKLAAGVMIGDNTILCRAENATLAEQGGAVVLERLIHLARHVLEGFALERPHLPPPAAVGLASAGYIDDQRGVVLFASENLPGWTGQRLAEQLETAFGLPAAVANDGSCFAVAESRLGAGRGCRHLLVVTIGTGVGGGIVVNDELYSGWQGRAGAIGHLCVQPVNGRPCTCGLTGCLESYTATRIMVAESGYSSIQALAAHYVAGSEEPAVDEAAFWLGRGLASLSHILGPEAIIVGGSVGLLGERYLALVRQSFLNHAMPLHHGTQIQAARLSADAGLVGAGLLARRRLLSEGTTGDAH